MEENVVQTVKNVARIFTLGSKKSGIKWRLAFQDYILIWLSVLDHVLCPPAPMEFPTKNVNFMLYDFLGCVGNFETYPFERDCHPNIIFDPVSPLILDLLKFVWLVYLVQWDSSPMQKVPFKYLRSLISWHANYPTASPQLECVDRVLICLVFHPLQEEVLNCFFFFFRRISRFRGQKKTLPIFCRVVFWDLWQKSLGKKSGDVFFGPTDPEGTWWVHDLPDLVITGAVSSTPRTPKRFSGAECVTAFGARCVFFSVGCWLLGNDGWKKLVEFWDEFVQLFPLGFWVLGKKDIRTNLVKHCYWMLLTLGPCHFKLMIARNNFWLSSKVRGTFCWREEDVIVLPTIGYTWISLSWFFTDCTTVNQYKPPFGKICLLFLSILNKSKGISLTYPIYKWVINQLQSPLLLLTERPSGEKDLLLRTSFWRLIKGMIKCDSFWEWIKQTASVANDSWTQ